MSYPKKYLKYWVIGILMSMIGVIMARKMQGNLVEMLVSYAVALSGLFVIALGVSRKAKDTGEDEDLSL